MKKTILFLTLILASFYGFSQNSVYGVRAGVNISDLDFEDQFDDTPHTHRNGFMIGFFGEYKLSNLIDIAPEIQFSAEGSKEEELRINYIQLPVLFKFNLSNDFALAVGPQASLKAHEYDDGVKNFTFSGVAGIDYMITDEFFLDFRYKYGLQNLIDDEQGIEIKGNTMQIGFGVKF
ncbi:porin family protein [Mesoflavibacter sp. CH_XMU1404-2]|uniref:porin family protein n=1 Tax=Mesoflavibacter sp. CH_XMU1404-2 TaxID=3107766 RepID=UPI0017540298|nr:porin family protein [Flavobacteriaceae bacterium]